MRRDEMLKPAAIKRADDARGSTVAEVAETPRDTALQRGRIRPLHEQVDVVVAFEHQRIDSREHPLNMRSGFTGVGEQAEAPVSIAEYELRRLAGVVRHGIRMHFEVADDEG